MDCEIARSLMSSYIDKDINEIDKEELEKHLEKCPDCMDEYRLLLSTVQLCSELEELELPETFHQDLIQKLRGLGSNKVKNKFFNRNWSWVAGVAAVFLVAVIGISSLPGLNIGSKTATEEANYGGIAPQYAKSAGAAPAEPAATADDGREIMNFSKSKESPAIDMASNYALRSTAISLDKSTEQDLKSYERKIITSGSMYLEVTDFDNKMKNIEELAVRNGGYVENSNVENNVYYAAEGKEDKLKTGSITLRIPAAKFNSIVEEIKTYGEIINNNTNSVDITEQYYDTTVRIDNLKVQENRLRELVSMAKNVDEILKIENELNRVRSEIELLSTDVKRWDKQVSLASLYISLKEVKTGKLETVNVPTIWGKAYKGFVGAINNIIRGIEKLFIFVVSAVPYMAILVAICAAAYIIMRRIKSKRAK